MEIDTPKSKSEDNLNISVSFAGRIALIAKAKDEKIGLNKALESIELKITSSDGEVEICEVEWDIIERRQGNIMPPYISDIEVWKERE